MPDVARAISLRNDELATVREGMRSLNRMVDAVCGGQAEKFVLTRHGQMCAVVLSVDEYALLAARRGHVLPLLRTELAR